MPRICADIVSWDDGRVVAQCDIASLAGIAPLFTITRVEFRYDNAADEFLTNARVMIKDVARGLDAVTDNDMLIDVDLTGFALPIACADADDIEGAELCGCTRRIACDEFAEGSRMLHIILDSQKTLGMREIAFTIVAIEPAVITPARGKRARVRA